MRQILLLILSALFAATAQAACRVEPRGAVPLDIVDGHILVTVAVNDVAATFILDTGADRTLMGEDVVRRLGLERDGWVRPPSAASAASSSARTPCPARCVSAPRRCAAGRSPATPA
jgi:predicted aspartyl protease